MKVSIIGAGEVGSKTAHLISLKKLADVVLLDIVEGFAEGKALDIREALPVEDSDTSIRGTTDYVETKDSDIVVITAGIARKEGMSRDDLLETNKKIVASVTEQVAKFSPNTIIIVVSNPLDAMVYVVYKTSKFPKNRVVGMAGTLDTTRFRAFLSDELNVASNKIEAMVLGGHGDLMVPLIKNTKIEGKPITELLSEKRIEQIVERVRFAGGEIVSLLKTASASFAPASAITEMVNAIINDEKKVLPGAAYLDGEYGFKGIFLGVPIILGKNGVEKIVELDLSTEEKKNLKKSAEHVKELIEKLNL